MMQGKSERNTTGTEEDPALNNDAILSTLKRMVVEEWWFVLVIGVCALGTIYGYMNSGKSTSPLSPVPANKTAVTVPSDGVSRPESDAQAPAIPSPPVKRPTEQEVALNVIKEHQEKIDADPKAPDAPAYWYAMGNLYMTKLVDYKEAVRCYELLLLNHPNWDGAAKVYLHRATCYERLGDDQKKRWAYEEMLKNLPEESQEYQFAKVQLGR